MTIAQLKLTRGEILDLATQQFIITLCDRATEYYDLMRAKQKEADAIQSQIRDNQAVTSKYNEMIEDLNNTCARIVRKHGFTAPKFEMTTYVHGNEVDLTVRVSTPKKTVKARKASKTLLDKAAQLKKEADAAHMEGMKYHDKARAIERNKKDARNIMLQEIAKDSGVVEQINSLVGTLVEATINQD